MPIHVLPDALVARIAAGEVVERPASVVKELVENAIDAGARDIRVECAEGGRRLIRITDDGSGIRADEVALAFTHHATSKLTAIDDLSTIATLGFRGEALASVASVSQMSCATRHADESAGTLLRLDNGAIVSEERVGRTPGTTMTIEHLFARVPARLKFLKSNQTERGHIDGILTRYAMAYPHIRFSLTHDGRMSFQTTGTGSLRDVLVEVYGADAAGHMVEIAPRGEQAQLAGLQSAGTAIQVTGVTALPTLDHSNRSKITLFVNGRPVQDVKLTYAVIQAYHTLLMTGRFPVAVVMVRMTPDDVDVNVHPAKAEVRFRDADSVFSAVQRAVRRTLLDALPVPEAPSILSRVSSPLADILPAAALVDGPAAPVSSGDGVVSAQPDRYSSAQPSTQPGLTGSEVWERVGIAKQGGAIAVPAAAPVIQAGTRSLPALRILGQLAQTYILAEGPEGLYLIDQHASHERILFERLLAQRDLGEVISQSLIDPVPVDVPADSAYLLDEQLPMLHDLGFELDHFGGNTYLVRAVPAPMVQDDIATAIRQIIADLEVGDSPLRKDIEAKVLRRVCKRMSIKAGRTLSFPEMQALIRDLEACDSPRTCPHGRPTMIHIGVAQLEREFGRLG